MTKPYGPELQHCLCVYIVYMCVFVCVRAAIVTLSFTFRRMCRVLVFKAWAARDATLSANRPSPAGCGGNSSARQDLAGGGKKKEGRGGKKNWSCWVAMAMRCGYHLLFSLSLPIFRSLRAQWGGCSAAVTAVKDAGIPHREARAVQLGVKVTRSECVRAG